MEDGRITEAERDYIMDSIGPLRREKVARLVDTLTRPESCLIPLPRLNNVDSFRELRGGPF